MGRTCHRLLGVSILIGGSLRFLMLGSQSLWVDETGTLMNVLNPGTSITHFAFHGNNAPPLYFLTLWPILQILGDGEFALRFLSALSGTLTIPLFWLLARRIVSKSRGADLAALLLALNPLHLWFSQEARPYAFFLLLFTASALFFLRAMERPERLWRWVGLTVILLLTALTHTLSVILVPLFAGWFFLFGPTRRKFLCCTAVGTLFATIALPVVVYISRISSVAPIARPFSGLEIPYTFFTFLSGYSFGPPVRSLQLLGFKEALLIHAPQTLLVLAALAVIGLLIVRRMSRERLPIYVWIVTPVLVATVIAIATLHSYNVRFALPALPAFLLLAADLISDFPVRARAAFVAFLIGIFLWADLQWFAVPAYGKEDTRAAVEIILRETSTVRKIAIAPAYAAATLSHYLQDAGSVAEVIPVEKAEEVDADALLITRRQHVPFADELEAQFRTAHADEHLGFFSATGYEMILVKGDPGP